MMALESPELSPYLETYIALGLRIFPVHAVKDGRCSCGAPTCTNGVGKHPRTPRGCLDATNERFQIIEWCRRWPETNWGIATGYEMSGGYLAVLDVDMPKDQAAGDGEETLRQLQMTYGDLPLTWRARTGSNGLHLFFITREPLENSSGRVGTFLDIRGHHGYVVAPPSTHLSGGTYEWIDKPSQTEISAMPDWLFTLAKKPHSPVRAQAGQPDKHIVGGRNVALASIAGSLRRPGLSAPAIYAALSQHNRERCAPPLDDYEIRRIAYGTISKYEPGAEPAVGEDPWHSMSGAALDADLPPIPWLCKGLHLAPGAVSLLAGYGSSYKTIISMSLGLSVAMGERFLGMHDVGQGRVIHLDYEQGTHGTVGKYKKIANEMGLKSFKDIDLVICPLPKNYLDEPNAEDMLLERCRDAKLCIIDSFRAAHNKVDENDSKVRSYLDTMSRISEATGCTMWCIVHAGKPKTDAPQGAKYAPRGSSAIYDAAQTVFVVGGKKNEPVTMTHEKTRLGGRHVEDFCVGLEDTEDGFGLRVFHMELEQMREVKLAGATSLAAAAIELMRAAPYGVSPKDVADHADMPLDQLVRAKLADMARRGQLMVVGEGPKLKYRLSPTLQERLVCPDTPEAEDV